MHPTILKGQFTHRDVHTNTAPLEQARRWIGCRLILRSPYLGYSPGRACIVMCVVDFGEDQA